MNMAIIYLRVNLISVVDLESILTLCRVAKDLVSRWSRGGETPVQEGGQHTREDVALAITASGEQDSYYKGLL